MDELSEHINNLRLKYREIFLDLAKKIESEVLNLKPENLSGEIFDYYEQFSDGKSWQENVLSMIKNIYYPEMIEMQAQINNIRNNYCCNGCGSCCRLACSEFSYEELKNKAKIGDNFAKQFVQTFLPYETLQEAEKIFPEYIALLKSENESGYYFYHCPKVTSDNRCPDYENRPQICRDFPDNPIAFLPLSCGYMGWKLKSELMSLRLNALKEIVGFYIQNLDKLQN